MCALRLSQSAFIDKYCRRYSWTTVSRLMPDCNTQLQNENTNFFCVSISQRAFLLHIIM